MAEITELSRLVRAEMPQLLGRDGVRFLYRNDVELPNVYRLATSQQAAKNHSVHIFQNPEGVFVDASDAALEYSGMAPYITADVMVASIMRNLGLRGEAEDATQEGLQQALASEMVMRFLDQKYHFHTQHRYEPLNLAGTRICVDTAFKQPANMLPYSGVKDQFVTTPVQVLAGIWRRGVAVGGFSSDLRRSTNEHIEELQRYLVFNLHQDESVEEILTGLHSHRDALTNIIDFQNNYALGRLAELVEQSAMPMGVRDTRRLRSWVEVSGRVNGRMATTAAAD